MKTITTLTPAVLDAPVCVRICDPQTPGLVIETLRSGRKRWQFRRRLKGGTTVFKINLGFYPRYSIGEAREWAGKLNAIVDAGKDPRDVARADAAERAMTVDYAHELYMIAVHEGRSSRAKRPNKPRTISDKLEIFKLDIQPFLGKRLIKEVTETDLVKLVTAKGTKARVRANRLAAELKVFFGWCASLRGTEVGLETDPSRRLGDLKFPETPRSRRLSNDEIGWFLQAVAEEETTIRRGMLLWLLTAARFAEVCRAKACEVQAGIWTIPATRTKNSVEHRIALGPWGRVLMQADGEWVFPALRIDGPRTTCWYKARDRVKRRMAALAGRDIEHFTPHDFRRTSRSNTKRLKVDFETAEAMLNHVKKGLERTYDTYELEEEKRAWFLLWENEITAIARKAGIADRLEIPDQCESEGADEKDDSG